MTKYIIFAFVIVCLIFTNIFMYQKYKAKVKEVTQLKEQVKSLKEYSSYLDKIIINDNRINRNENRQIQNVDNSTDIVGYANFLYTNNNSTQAVQNTNARQASDRAGNIQTR